MNTLLIFLFAYANAKNLLLLLYAWIVKPHRPYLKVFDKQFKIHTKSGTEKTLSKLRIPNICDFITPNINRFNCNSHNSNYWQMIRNSVTVNWNYMWFSNTHLGHRSCNHQQRLQYIANTWRDSVSKNKIYGLIITVLPIKCHIIYCRDILIRPYMWASYCNDRRWKSFD